MDLLKKELSECDIKQRVNNLYTFWDKNFDDVDCLVVKDGSDDSDSLKIKTIAIHAWLFKCEMLETILVITKNSIIFLGSEEMIKTLSILTEKLSQINVEFHLLTKSANIESHNLKIF